MPHRLIDRIREKIRLREYDMTVHAMEEMAEDELDILDMEEAVLNGKVVRSDTREVRRLHSSSRFLIITVYEIDEAH